MSAVSLDKEVDLYTQIIDFVNSTGCYAYRNSAGGRGRYRFGIKGQADISGVIFGSGKRLEIEVKRPGKDPSDKQRDFLFNMSCRGAVVMCVTSLDEVIEEFRRLGLCRV